MTKKLDLSKDISERAGVPAYIVSKVLSALSGSMTDILKDGGEVSIIGIGKLTSRDMIARTIKSSLIGGRSVAVPARKRVHFAASSVIKRKLNAA